MDGKAEKTETRRLLRAYRRGDAAARDRLVELYMPLVESLARRHRRRGEDLDDLIQAGSIGLIKAIEGFRFDRGVELSAYAVPTIDGEIKRQLRDTGSPVRVPRRLQEVGAQARRASGELTAKLGRAPTNSELARKLEVDEAVVVEALEAERAQSTTRLPSADDGAEVEGDADDALGPGEDRLILAEAFHVLDEDERRLVYMRFIEGASRTKAARELGISQRQLSRRTNAALSKLRAELEGGAGTDNGKARASSPPKAKPTPSKSLSAEGDALNMDAMASGTAREVEKFLELPYHVVITRDPDAQDGAHWKANVEELPGCEARGATSEEAARAIYRAMEDWIGGALAKGANVPEPKRQSQASGRLLLRMPQTLHAELARRADREEVSLNGLITGLLASAVGWQREDGVPSEGSDAAQPPRSRFLSTAILVNIVVMALAAIAAVILLILAWQNL